MTRSLLMVTIVAIVLLAPAAMAAPIYGLTSPGFTGEDDGEVISASGNRYDSVRNRIVYPGGTPGDGGLFLDAHLASTLGDIDLYPGAATQLAVGRSNILLPGMMHATAYFGWWADLDDDGRIDDLHDEKCKPNCATDEFAWRGEATDEALGMQLFMIPQVIAGVSGGGVTSNLASSGTQYFNDRTGRDREVQEWASELNIAVSLYLDASTLATIQTFVIAGARVTQSGTFYDLNDPAGLHDVDRYEALNPDVAALWTSTLDTKVPIPTVPGTEDLPPAKGIPAFVVAIILDAASPVTEHLPSVPDPDENPPVTVTRAQNKATMTPYPKEPNHADDDYGGRALFGGVGDFEGSFNTYPAYADGHHYYVDTLSRQRACTGAQASAPGVPTTVSVEPTCSAGTLDIDGAQKGSARTTGHSLTFEAIPLLWRDWNRDTHLGSVCDPNSEAFDAERNTCRIDPASRAYPWPQSYPAGETWRACPSTYREFGIRLTPMGGDWPDVVVIRDHAEIGRSGTEFVELYDDRSVIELRWGSECQSLASQLHSRDAIVFPYGSPNAVRVETYFRIDAFSDVNAGIAITDEYVRDVDILAPTL